MKEKLEFNYHNIKEGGISVYDMDDNKKFVTRIDRFRKITFLETISEDAKNQIREKVFFVNPPFPLQRYALITSFDEVYSKFIIRSVVEPQINEAGIKEYFYITLYNKISIDSKREELFEILKAGNESFEKIKTSNSEILFFSKRIGCSVRYLENNADYISITFYDNDEMTEQEFQRLSGK